MKYFFAGIVILAIFFGIGVSSFYSSTVSMDENILSLDNQIQNMYARRSDLVPEIAGVVKAMSNYEWSVIKDTTALRGASENITKLEQLKASGSISSAEFSTLLMSTMGTMKIMSEQYPKLEGVAKYGDLMVTIEGSDNRLRTAIKDYNDSVPAYNAKIRSFPYGVMFSGMFGFKRKDRTYTASEKNQNANSAVPNTSDLLK